MVSSLARGWFKRPTGISTGQLPAAGLTSLGQSSATSPEAPQTILYSFCAQANRADGALAYDRLFQATDGIFYGATFFSGAYGDGTVFSLDVGLGPFVAFVRNSGKVGVNVQILGQGFTGTTAVSFNGTPATFRS
jgi:uncharacterized repeat protein (TIGR03803 family)